MPKPLIWVGSSRKDFADFSAEVQDEMGYALYQAQVGKKHEHAKPLRGFGGAGVLEIFISHRGDAFRTVYTVRYSNAIYVLHVFQKKSKHGIATPKAEIDLVKARLKEAERHYEDASENEG